MKEKIINIPNTITTIRLILLPFAIFNILTGNNVTAFILILISYITDFFDGTIARLTNSATYFGMIYDGIVDRSFIIFSLIALIIMPQTRILSLIILSSLIISDLIIGLLTYKKYKKSYLDIYKKRDSLGLFAYVSVLLITLNNQLPLYVIIPITIYALVDYLKFIKQHLKK